MGHMMKTRMRISGLAFVLSLCACYSYVPAEFEAVPLGEDVRVYLTNEGMVRFAQVSGGDALDMMAVEVWRFENGRRSERYTDRVPVRLGGETLGEIALEEIFVR